MKEKLVSVATKASPISTQHLESENLNCLTPKQSKANEFPLPRDPSKAQRQTHNMHSRVNAASTNSTFISSLFYDLFFVSQSNRMNFNLAMELRFSDLLRAAWVAGILPILVASIPSSCINPLHRILLGFARRGKIMNSSSRKFTVPQRFFLHFYLVAVVWTSFLLFLTWFYAYKMVPLGSESFEYPTVVSQLTGGSHSFSTSQSQLISVEQKYSVWRAVFLLLLMEVQVWRRLYENLHVFNYSPSARMHIFGYLTGLFFYTAAPLSFCCACAPDVLKFTTQHVAEFIVKGREKMPIIEFDWSGYVEPLTKLGWCQWIGAIIFFWGWIHQCRCHAILGSLREDKEQADEYVIPHGDWFEMVSCPHYLAEIVIYAGILIASEGSDLTIWLLFAFVVANLGFAAAETQRWYHRKFKNYPPTRHAIIPFIY